MESCDEVPVKQFIAKLGFPDSPAPPCEDYDRLQPISVLLNILEEYKKCQTPNQLKDCELKIAAELISCLCSQFSKHHFNA